MAASLSSAKRQPSSLSATETPGGTPYYHFGHNYEGYRQGGEHGKPIEFHLTIYRSKQHLNSITSLASLGFNPVSPTAANS
jgi:hypothetical protein